MEVVDYDPGWPDCFRQERDRLRSALPGLFADIQHIGSTAVPGLAAKPVVDMMASVENLDQALAAVADIEGLGYRYVPEAGLPGRLFFKRDADARRSHHLQVVEHATLHTRSQLLLRDLLRRDPVARERYAELKRDLATRFAHDSRGYTAGKTPLLQDLVNEALRGAGLAPLDDVWEGERS